MQVVKGGHDEGHKFFFTLGIDIQLNGDGVAGRTDHRSLEGANIIDFHFDGITFLERVFDLPQWINERNGKAAGLYVFHQPAVGNITFLGKSQFA